MLRNAIERNMLADSECAKAFKVRWRQAMLECDKRSFGHEIERSDEEWIREWDRELELVKVHQPTLQRSLRDRFCLCGLQFLFYSTGGLQLGRKAFSRAAI